MADSDDEEINRSPRRRGQRPFQTSANITSGSVPDVVSSAPMRRGLTVTAPAAPGRRQQPSQKHYEQYIENLFGIQKFVKNLNELLPACDVKDEDSDDFIRDIVSSYLVPLSVYEEDMCQIRRHIGPAEDDSSVPEVLVELLDKIEPECLSAIQQLKRLENSLAKSSKAKAVTVEEVQVSDPFVIGPTSHVTDSTASG